jgi:ketosteroid isomerase-like protein
MKLPLHLLAAVFGLLSCSARLPAAPASVAEAELRTAEKALANALMSSDPTEWVYHYTEDAVFVSPGSPPVNGRAELLKMAKTMQPLSSVVITPIKTEASGTVAAVLVHGSWVSGAKSETPKTTSARNIIVWRKEADGKWRVALELLHSDPSDVLRTKWPTMR